MDLLGGYESDDEEESSGARAHGGPTAATAAASSSGAQNATAAMPLSAQAEVLPAAGSRKKVVNFSKLPVAKTKPLALDGEGGAAGDGDEPPLKRLAALEALRASDGRSLLDALPAPRKTLGSAAGGPEGRGSGGVRIDLSALSRPRAAPKAAVVPPETLLRREGLPDAVREGQEEVPSIALGHRLFEQASTTGGDGPSADDLEHMRSLKSFTKIDAEMVQDPEWFTKNQISGGGPGLHVGKRVPKEMSMYEHDTWNETTHKNPSRIQKRKHQINWLAQEAMDKEAEMLDRNATSRLTKSQTAMKYGW